MALGVEDPSKVKVRKKKFLQLSQQQIRQLKQSQEVAEQEEQPDQENQLQENAASPRNEEGKKPLQKEPQKDQQKDQKEQQKDHPKDQQDLQPEHPPVNFNIFPYYHDAVKCHAKLKSHNPKDWSKGATEIGEVAWNGGEQTQTFIGQCGVLKTLANLLDISVDVPGLKLKIVRSLGILCRGNIEIQDQLVELNFVHKIYTILDDPSEEMRKWTTNTLFYMLNDCRNAHVAALKIHELKDRLETIQNNDNWASWNFNDAKEILKMLRLRSCEEE